MFRGSSKALNQLHSIKKNRIHNTWELKPAETEEEVAGEKSVEVMLLSPGITECRHVSLCVDGWFPHVPG